MVLWGFQSVRQNHFGHRTLRGQLSLNLNYQIKKKPKIQMQNLTEVMSRMFSLPKMERGQCWTRKEQYNNDTRLCGHSPEPLRVIRDDSQRLCVLTSPLSPPLTIFRIKKKKKERKSQITLHEDVLIQTDS